MRTLKPLVSASYEDDLYLRDYINAGIAELEKIAAAQHLQDDELRICYAFDC